LSSIIVGAVVSGCGGEFFGVDEEEVFVVDVAEEEVSVVDVEEFFKVDVDDDESSVVGVVAADEVLLVEVDDEEFFLDDVADDSIFESLKASAFDDVIETGSEVDDNDEPGRLLLSV
jgi:hypothetical protein